MYSGDILLDQKSYKTYEKILLYDILHKTLAGGKTLRIRFDSIHHNFGRIRADSYNSLPIEKILTVYKVIILKNRNKNNYYYNIFLEKGSYNDKSNTDYFKTIFCLL